MPLTIGLVVAMALCGAVSSAQSKTSVNSMETKENIGKKLALYPMPLTVVGAIVDESVNWLLVAHVGIIGHDKILVNASSG